ncbi:MAG: PPC domain-containing protein [Bacteroidetes bacterium]|nr:PPC domain-containing protein [Bacteroidota bacterium]
MPCSANPLSLGVTENGNNACTGSTSEPNAPSCWTSGVRNTIWYSFVAPASGQVSIRTLLGTLINTQIAVYQGACGSLSQVAPNASSCNDNLTGSEHEASQVNLTGLTSGNTYYVVVDGANDMIGTFQIVAIDPATQSFPSTPGQDCSIAFPTCNSILTYLIQDMQTPVVLVILMALMIVQVVKGICLV